MVDDAEAHVEKVEVGGQKIGGLQNLADGRVLCGGVGGKASAEEDHQDGDERREGPVGRGREGERPQQGEGAEQEDEGGVQHEGLEEDFGKPETRAEAREKGDLSENAEYEAAREAQGLLEVKIAKLQNLVANAKIIDESQVGTDVVRMLNKVKVQNLTINREMEFTIVGETEADFAHGKLAATTPIAKALIGHAKGETVEAQVPSGVMKFKILDISI